MRRLTNRTSFAAALGAQLAAIWLALAPGLVFCVEKDGQISLEASSEGTLCGATALDATPAAALIVTQSNADHCDDCRDVALQLADLVTSERHRIQSLSPVLSAVPGLSALALIKQNSWPMPAPTARALRATSQRSPILRT